MRASHLAWLVFGLLHAAACREDLRAGGDTNDGTATDGTGSSSAGSSSPSSATSADSGDSGACRGCPCGVDDDCAAALTCESDVCVATSVLHVAAGTAHTCAVLSTGRVRCFGEADSGRIGHGNVEDIGDDEPARSAPSVDVGGYVTSACAGGSHTCVLLDDGAVRCWGDALYGQIGLAGGVEDIGDDETPSNAGDVDVGDEVVALTCGTQHTCAVTAAGAVRCWGNAGDGRLGYGNTNNVGDNEAPAVAGDVPIGGAASAVAAGDAHTCALLIGGAVRCWGKGADGRLGHADTASIGDNEPASVGGDVNIGGNAVAIACGGAHTCVLLDTKTVRCWGDGSAGQLGYGNTNDVGDSEVPNDVGDVQVGTSVQAIAAGAQHTCALLENGEMQCWGSGGSGRLGYGNLDSIGDDEMPSAAGTVQVGDVATAIATGSAHTCAVLSAGGIRCFGSGTNGRLGYGNQLSVGDDEIPSDRPEVPLF